MVEGQTIRESVNKGIIIGFNVVTASAATTDVITAAKISASGGKVIRDIHLKCTGDDGWLGLGKDAAAISAGAANATQDIIPLFQDSYVDLENVSYLTLDIIRNASTNITVKGWVVVN